MIELNPIFQELNTICPNGVFQSVALKEFSYWKVGGLADYLIEPQSIDQLSEVIKYLKNQSQLPYMVIGDGSNLLFDDGGYRGVIIRIGNNMSQVKFQGTEVTCEAGVWVPGLAYSSYRKGLTGLEHTCGIPGRLGGLIYMNGGSNRQAISENLKSVILIDEEGHIHTIDANEFDFEYRTSPFQTLKYIIAGAVLKLEVSNVPEVRNAMRKILTSRRKKFPRKQPNCGSVFISNPKMYDLIGPPGFAIEQVGLKGLRKGDAQISPLHANFIVNLGGASSTDILYLISLARKKVYENTNFLMDCEARYVYQSGEICQAHVRAEEMFGCSK
jgi:UDP-N-acetylmuramate dehydrogenase